MDPPRVTIAVPHFNTPRLTRVCLRALRRHTPPSCGAEVLVIENGSTDGSGEALARIPWVRLIARRPEPGEEPSASHGRALNLAWERSEAPYFLAIHTDTIVRREGWLDLLLGRIESGPRVFAAGSDKLEERSALGFALKAAGDLLAAIVSRRARARLGADRRPFIRSHCALYRRALVAGEGLRPHDGRSTCGLALHRTMVERGYQAAVIPPRELAPYVLHLRHATLAGNPTPATRRRTVAHGRRRLERFFAEPWVRELEADDALDDF